MLNEALSGEGVTNVNVVAILNDTTGTLVAGSHDHSNCAIGLLSILSSTILNPLLLHRSHPWDWKQCRIQ